LASPDAASPEQSFFLIAANREHAEAENNYAEAVKTFADFDSGAAVPLPWALMMIAMRFGFGYCPPAVAREMRTMKVPVSVSAPARRSGMRARPSEIQRQMP
jgi:hypothetical protein